MQSMKGIKSLPVIIVSGVIGRVVKIETLVPQKA